MSSAADEVIRKVYQLTVDLLRVQIISSIEQGDVTFDRLRTQLQTDFEILHEKLDRLLVADLRAAEENLLTAMTCVGNGNAAPALTYFQSAEQHAIKAFSTAADFESKFISIKIRMLAQVYLRGYFTDFCEKQLLETLCQELILKLVNTIEVQTALKETLPVDGVFRMIWKSALRLVAGDGNQTKRKSLLIDVAEFCCTVTKVTGVTYNLREATTSRDLIIWKPHCVTSLKVSAVCLHPVNNRLFGCFGDLSIKVWDLTTLTEVTELAGHLGDIWALAHEGNRLYSGSYDNTVGVWDALTLARVATLTGHTNHVKAVIAADGKLFSASADKTIKVWDGNTLTLLATLRGHSDKVSALAVSGGRLYSGSWDTTIVVWDLTTYTQSAVLRGHSEQVTVLAIAEGRLYSAPCNNNIKVWDLNRLEAANLLVGHTDKVCALSIAHGRLYSGSMDRTIKGWDLETLKVVITLTGHADHVCALATADGRLFSGSHDRTLGMCYPGGNEMSSKVVVSL